MPTTRPRHVVTETDDIAEALDAAAERWPDLSRSQLLARLALEGHAAAQATKDRQRSVRLAAVRRHRGAATGCYGDGYLDEVRAGWPK